MSSKKKIDQLGGSITFIAILLNCIIVQNGYIIHENWYFLLLITIPLLLVSIRWARTRTS